MIFQLYPLFIVLEKPGYIALWVRFLGILGGGCHFFITLQFNYIYCMCVGCVGKVKFPLLRFDS